MLSQNQVYILDQLESANQPTCLHEIAEWHINGVSYPYGDDAARNAMKRLEERELVVGSGQGRTRSFAITRLGIEELAGARGQEPPPLPQDSSPTRLYVVLEQYDVAELDVTELAKMLDGHDTVYVLRQHVEARNTEHAIRQTAKDSYVDVDADPTLIPVAERMWQPTKVRIRNQQSISIA